MVIGGYGINFPENGVWVVVALIHFIVIMTAYSSTAAQVYVTQLAVN